MKYSTIAFVTLILIHKPTQGIVQHEHGTFFRKVNDERENVRADASTSIIHEIFHKCDLDAACNYVVEDVKRKKYSKIADGNNLPAAGKDMSIWAKGELA